jgi:hypothetical protein
VNNLLLLFFGAMFSGTGLSLKQILLRVHNMAVPFQKLFVLSK